MEARVEQRKRNPNTTQKHRQNIPNWHTRRPILLFTDYSMNNCKHYFNWLWDWTFKETIVFITIQWMTGKVEHWLHCENEDKIDQSYKSQWKYEAKIYLTRNAWQSLAYSPLANTNDTHC